jgi:hypothetical protein
MLTPEQRQEQREIRERLEQSGKYRSISVPIDRDAIQGEGEDAAYLFYVKTPVQTHSQVLLQQPQRRKP